MGYTKDQIVAAFKEWHSVYVNKEGCTQYSGELTDNSHVEYGDYLCELMDKQSSSDK